MDPEVHDMFTETIAMVLCTVAVAVIFLWRHPRLVAFLVLSSLLWWSLQAPGVLALAVLIALLLGVWRMVGPHSFRRWVSGPISRARRKGRYKRLWPALTAAHRLSWAPHPRSNVGRRGSYWELLMPAAKGATPKLRRIRLDQWVDRLEVCMLPGQIPEDWEDQADGLAHAVGARDARIRVTGPGRVTVELFYADPLAAVVPALPIPARVDLGAVPVGIRDDGQVWTVPVLWWHWLIAGVTGSGKGSVLWSLLRGLGPAIRTGEVQIFALDPKGGMELAPGQTMFTRFAAENYEAMADLLDDAMAIMQARARRLAGVTRKHHPTPEEPLIVVLIDELANLTAYQPDRKLRDRITQSVSLLLTQGRAVGVSVIAALQDPRKEVVAFRNLFSGKVALRLDEPLQVDMVLGDGARDQGARCDQIPDSLPGVGYARIDGVREPIRVRAGWVTDDDIDEMAVVFPAPSSVQRAPHNGQDNDERSPQEAA